MNSDADPGLVFDAAGNPRSSRFDDFYFQSGQGVAESAFVFLSGCGLPETWRGRRRFVVAETGFGSGLNFLLTWDAWRRSARGDQHLHFVSAERYPLSRAELAQVHRLWPDLAPLAKRLQDQYPAPVSGYHRLLLDRSVTLTLLIGDAREQLEQLEARVDAWYLDGFAPARNPQMWDRDLLAEVARLSVQGARLATFTAAGQVRRDLDSLGFEVRRTPGFGAKRERIVGRYTGQPFSRCPPWFAPAATTQSGKDAGNTRIAVIGSGVGGHFARIALERRGYSCIQYSDGPGASAIPAASVMPSLEVGDSARSRFFWHAFQFAVSHWDRQANWSPCGALLLATDQRQRHRLRSIAQSWPGEVAQWCDQPLARERAGLEVSAPGLYFPGAGVVRRFSADGGSGKVAGVTPEADGWRVHGADADGHVDAVVVCTGSHPPPMETGIEIQRWHGLALRLAATARSRSLLCALHGSGYLLPCASDGHWAGASFRRDGHPADEDERTGLLSKLAAGFPTGLLQGAVTNSWSGVRAALPDRLPLAGPLMDVEPSRRNLHWVRHGPPAPGRDAPVVWQRGAWLMAGLGARGFTTAPLLGEWLASMISADPWPLPRDVGLAVCSSRFLVRQLRRNQDLSR